ncbi:hypothetical protein MUY27_02370 [Mucilaginibacter sp. RS28]|uniref:Lipocalin-like domain-containing protein n=1 Tax=Mucilaginibacter straminoryzae TaxID=2932774 RepID=A0A9X1WZL0_9SPHI|nr:hypothetical protein [Mucilaginibacter straminoryzae]MCJ8208537.1 hypothetical protein [Mucilaginibacter straminoryzae]
MKRNLLLLLSLIVVLVVYNSCKKERQSYLPTLLTSSTWELASVQVTTYQGSTQLGTATLNTNCQLKQTFTFNPDQSCSYQNFICRSDIASGKWQFSDDKLTLQANMLCKDTVPGGKDTVDAPFLNARIVNLGSYSLVLETGDINEYSGSTKKRVIRRFAFVHQ